MHGRDEKYIKNIIGKPVHRWENNIEMYLREIG
jgi:hypothetical protein